MKKLVLGVVFLVSTSLLAQAYVGVHGNFERVSSSGIAWNSAGGGLNIGMAIMPGLLSLEGYFDFLKHIDPVASIQGVDPSFLSGLSLSMYSMHFGGRLAVSFADILVVKGGAGLARQTISLLGVSQSESNVEVSGSAGVRLPLGPALKFTVDFVVRRVMATTAYNMFGGQAGVEIGF